ncbi:hypothetical protein WJX81_002339 [Elliptochloris bilobata]|uniref:Aldose 1-epimerase n=1 Tax=Elliptochloris bilobata TaxID=381761 RepID=A0AAW1RGH9_9CHLO
MSNVTAIVLTNGVIQADILPVGAVVQRLLVPDARGLALDVVLGYDDWRVYRDNSGPYFGGVVGRVANRIAGARFRLKGKDYRLYANEGPNTLHSGPGPAWNNRLWTVTARNATSVSLSLNSPAYDQGFPSAVNATMTYTLTPANELEAVMEATSDGATPVNMAQHSYFNLEGGASGATVLSHTVEMPNALHYLPVDNASIPTGKVASVLGTPFDFTTPRTIGSRIGQVTGNPGGYDHNMVLFNLTAETARERVSDCQAQASAELAARVVAPASGRAMELYTNQPGVQFYTGNFLNGSVIGKAGYRCGRGTGSQT